jgi:hypothetical protein
VDDGSTQVWSAQDYAANARFVAELAGEAVALLAPRAGETNCRSFGAARVNCLPQPTNWSGTGCPATKTTAKPGAENPVQEYDVG